MHTTAEGIVLKQNKISNNRRIIVLFTKEYGKISAGSNLSERGKGKSALGIRPYTYAEYELYKSRGFYNINSASVRKSYYSIGEDLDRFLIASKVLRYLDGILPEEEARPSLFRLTLDLLDCISQAKGHLDTVFYAYIVKTLPMNGIMPEIGRCVNCGKDRAAFGARPGFTVSGGGILCPDCILGLKEGGDTLIYEPEFDIVEVLRYLSRKPFEAFTRISLRPEVQGEVRRILSDYLDYYLNIDVLNDDLTL